jgi:hypothetical protein
MVRIWPIRPELALCGHVLPAQVPLRALIEIYAAAQGKYGNRVSTGDKFVAKVVQSLELDAEVVLLMEQEGETDAVGKVAAVVVDMLDGIAVDARVLGIRQHVSGLAVEIADTVDRDDAVQRKIDAFRFRRGGQRPFAVANLAEILEGDFEGEIFM